MATPDSIPALTPLLDIKDLTVSYGGIRALKGISLQLFSGEVVALLGTNGAGKSTLLRTISCLIRPTAGSISIDRVALTSLKPLDVVRLGVAHCPEGRRVFGGLSVAENMRLGAAIRTDPAGVKQDQEKMLEIFPILRQRWHQAANTMSGGEQQLLALARALMSSPRLLLLDEPTLGVAPLLSKEIFKSLALLKAQGTTMLVVEQNMALALELADRAYVLRTGKIVLSGSAEELRDGDNVAQAYLGSET